MLRSRLHVLPLMPFLSLLLHPAAPALAAPAAHATLTGVEVHIYDLVGRVELVPGNGPAVQVDLAPGGRDASRLGTQTFASGGTFFVVSYPSNHIRNPQMHWGSNTSVQVAKDGTFGNHPKRGGWLDRRVRIDGNAGGLEAWCDLRIVVPRGQHVSVHV